MTLPTGEQAGRLLALLRIAAGTGAWVAPEMAGVALGVKQGAHPPLPFVLRLFGSRDVAMGAGYLTAAPADRDRWLALGMAVDAADAAGALLAGRKGLMPERVMWPAALTALAAVALAARARTT